VLVRLLDGTRVVVREIRPEDKERLRTALGRLSPASNRSRFLAVKVGLSPRELRYLTEVDGLNHDALVAVEFDDPNRLVAVGRYVRLTDDPQAAEIAIVVGDCHQGQGLGRRLGLLLADRARARGIRRFTASMLADNVPAHRLFAAISDRLATEHHGSVDEIVAELDAPIAGLRAA
jgi:RimJ/RimL family protein N-acetyltransferase